MTIAKQYYTDSGNIIYCLSQYHKYWISWEQGIRNPDFNTYSKEILSLKRRDPEAVEFFYKILNDKIPPNVAICTVPSSDPKEQLSGITLLADKLALDKNRKNFVHYLKRTRKISKLASGGCRTKSTHYRSITTDKDLSVKGLTILLLDDVTTSGNSLRACRNILIRHGASRVYMLALGKTIPESPDPLQLQH